MKYEKKSDLHSCYFWFSDFDYFSLIVKKQKKKQSHRPTVKEEPKPYLEIFLLH